MTPDSGRCDYRWPLVDPSDDDRRDEVTHWCLRDVGHEDDHHCACGELSANRVVERISETELVGQVDAMVWAEQFMDIFGGKRIGDDGPDTGTMIGWFANSIMAGWDEHARRYPQPQGWVPTDDLGQQVEVYLGDEENRKVIVRGKLLGFGQGGDVEIMCDDGMIHYCWPMLDVRLVDGSEGG